MKRICYLFALCLVLAVTGCSSKKNKELPPLKLEKITHEVKLKKEWSTGVGAGQGKQWNKLAPAISGGQIFAADFKGQVVALDRFTGKRAWQRKLKKTRVSGGVGAGAGLVLLGTLDGELIALDANNGSDLWRTNVASEVLSAPVTNGDVVVVQTQDDRLIALDALSGQHLWIYESEPALLSLRGNSGPLITEHLVYAGLSTGKVIAIELEQGLPIWEQRIAMPSGRTELERMVDIDGRLLLKDGVLYVAAFQGRVAGLEADTGRILWQRDASSYVGLAQGFGNAYASLDNGVVESVDERSSTSMWSNDKLLRRQLSGPAVLSSYIAVGDLEGHLHLLSQVDGRFVGRTKVDGKGIRVQPLVVGSWLYIYGNGGKLVALTIK